MDKLNIKFYPQVTYNQSQIVKAFSEIENQFNNVVDGRLFPVKRLTAGTYEMNINDGILICDTSSGNITINLLPSDEWNGKVLTVKKIVAANFIIVDGFGAQTIDGGLTSSMATINLIRRFTAEGGAIFTV